MFYSMVRIRKGHLSIVEYCYGRCWGTSPFLLIDDIVIGLISSMLKLVDVNRCMGGCTQELTSTSFKLTLIKSFSGLKKCQIYYKIDKWKLLHVTSRNED